MRSEGLPAEFIAWQCSERRRLFDAMGSGHMPGFLGAHLPVVSTLNKAGSAFPVHSCAKGVGLLPHPAHLQQYVDELSECVDACRDLPAAATRGRRIAAAMSLYGHPDRIDPHVLGAIEIFHGHTHANLAREPRSTLLFTGEGPSYPSYLAHCAALFVEETSPYFQFLRGMRLLFEAECFHMRQPGYTSGYVFRVWECVEKTPRRLHTVTMSATRKQQVAK